MTTSRKTIAAVNVDAWQLLERAKPDGYSGALVATLKRLAAQRNISALNVLSMLATEGLFDTNGRVVVKKSMAAAHSYNRRAAKLGDAGALTAVADRISARGGRTSLKIATALYRRAFSKGYITAAFNLACAYQNRGRYKASVGWFRKAADAGDESALLSLARAELYGVGVRRNPMSSFKKLKKLARSKAKYWPPNWMQSDALMIMASALIEGWFVKRDYRAGIALMRRAATLGNVSARAQLSG
ncbi:MAG: hypothetical protein ABI591_15335 [Kofleriaceae bacterium]